MKAIILTRVSTKMQEEGLSLLAQSNRLQDYADRKGLEVIKTFEIVESSTRGERKQFMEMINFCKRQRETIAIVADTVDRVQRSFKESVLFDELMRQDKIELHFYREGMVLNSKSTSVDIMRWDFSVMGAKAYVLQLSENVRRSTEQKNKNGEITGLAPLGYENYIDERGKHFVRQKEPYASIIRQCYEMYSLGRASVAEITHYANMMGLRTQKGSLIHINTMHHILENPFYYGEMRTKRGLMPHVYPTLVSKELWDMCQEQKAIRAGLFLRTNDNNSLYRALITYGVTNRQCPCELKKGIYRYVTCWRKDNTKIYIREEEFTKRISPILNRIKLPDGIVIELQKELKTAKASERTLVYTFGFAHTKLNMDCFEENFGFLVTINSIDGEKLKSIDAYSPANNTKQKRVVSSILSNIYEYDFNDSQDLVQKLSGVIKNEYKDLLTNPTGTDSLSMHSKSSKSELVDISKKLIERFNSNDYTRDTYLKNINKIKKANSVKGRNLIVYCLQS